MSELGQRIRGLRSQRTWTLERAAQATGLARSTLSKIENGLMSPTYDALIKLATGFAVDISALFEPHVPDAQTTGANSSGSGSGRRSITRAAQGQALGTPVYAHLLLCNDLSNKLMTPFCSTITARAFEDFSDWDRHAGEELIYVLQGKIELFTEFYLPERLGVGDCAYLDSRMGHRVISVSKNNAQVLWVSTTQAGSAAGGPHAVL
jgi:DNA-binding XRE family transcriptional regulator